MRPALPKVNMVLSYLKQMDERQIYSNGGPLLKKLEERYGQFFNVDPARVVASANATLAIQGAAFLMPVDTFQVPAFTFPASLSAVINAGKNLQLTDINQKDWRLNPSESNEGASLGLVDVLPFGAPFDPRRNQNYEYVIFDAAASIGSEELDLSALKQGWAVVFSLHATKVLGIGEGGITIFGSKQLADDFRAWINFGFLGSRNSILPGINAKMSEISAAYGHAALDQWGEEKEDWKRAKFSSLGIGQSLGINSITANYSGVNPYWIADFKSPERVFVVERTLAIHGIETRKWWGLGCHKMPAFTKFVSGEVFDVTELIANRTLGLPCFREMTSGDFEYISEVLSKINLD
jgi:dTDP-4-amino-4,6-dideoxygalactose transaminase